MSGLLCCFVLCFPVEGYGAEQPVVLEQPASAPSPEAEPTAPSPQPVAAPVPPQSNPVPPPVMPVLSGPLSSIDISRSYWYNKFTAFANDIDRFFGDPRYFQEANKSMIQLNLSKLQQPGVGGDVVLDGQAKVDLPSTEKRLSLVFESNPEKSISNDAAQRPVIANEVVTSNKQSAALRIEKPPEVSPWHYSADAGLKASFPLEPFVRTRGSYSLPMEKWRMKVAESVFWFSTLGVGETTQVDFERLISEPAMFRASTTATWMNETHNFDMRQDFTVYHTLDERTALLYQASVNGVSEPQFQATEYVLLLLCRYRVHQSWIFFEVSPQLHFPKAKDYQISPMLTLRLEFLFDGSI